MTELLPGVEVPRCRGVKVYFIQASNGAVKIGRSNDVAQRLADLQTASPLELTLVGWSPAQFGWEPFLHQMFAADRLRGEWFAPSVRLLGVIADINTEIPNRTRVLRCHLETGLGVDRPKHRVSTVFSVHANHLTRGG